MLLLALSIAPGLAICLYIIYNDKHNREPPINLFTSFALGMLSIIPAAFFEFNTAIDEQKSIYSILFTTYIQIALVEEISKFLILRYYSFTRKSFDEPLDGIVYSVMVSMGSATVENLGYVFLSKNGITDAFTRMFTTVPAHATFAIIMGYYTGKAKFDTAKRTQLILKGVLWAIFVHGTYDTFLFLNESEWVLQYVSELLLISGAVISLFIAINFSLKLIRLHQFTSKQLFQTEPMLSIRHASDADIILIRELALQVWPQTYSAILKKEQIEYMLNMMYSEAALHKQLQDNHNFIIVYSAGVPIGFASYNEVAPQTFKLQKIYVLSLHQGKGIGKFIIDKVIEDIASKGATSLLLNVNRNNKAKYFYEKLGFHVIKEEYNEIGNGFFMNDYVMERKINQEKV